jgi:RHS repeat-associated protein
MPRPLHAIFLAFFLILGSFNVTAQPTVTYFHNDISGSPMLATDAAGKQVWKESYRPYGQKLRDEPASRDGKNKIGFAGSPFDASTGLSYMGARYYDPVIGRFMGVDPVGFQENNVHSFNRYAYANNNPYKFVDRDGRIAILAAVPAAISALTPVAYAIGTRIAMSSVYRFGMAMAAGEVGLVAPAAVTVGAGAAAKGVANVVSDTFARAVPGHIKSNTLGAPGAKDVFVTNASELRGLSSKQIAEKLTIPESASFRIIEFPSKNIDGIASPINRTDAGFIGGGRTAGGASEFVIPNGSTPAGATERVVN